MKGKHAREHRIHLGSCRERSVGGISAVRDTSSNPSLVLSPAKSFDQQIIRKLNYSLQLLVPTLEVQSKYGHRKRK
jgi:hypothetical protein